MQLIGAKKIEVQYRILVIFPGVLSEVGWSGCDSRCRRVVLSGETVKMSFVWSVTCSADITADDFQCLHCMGDDDAKSVGDFLLDCTDKTVFRTLAAKVKP